MTEATIRLAVLVLGVLAALAIAGLVTLGFTQGETESIRTTLATVAISSVAAIAGLVGGISRREGE